MGSDRVAEHAPDPDEAPRHVVACQAFRIGRTPVTNAEYRVFVAATGHPAPSHWPRGAVPEGRELHPVTYVSWGDARAFCDWAGGRLPSEAEWERAARGDDDRAWPWGDEPPASDRATFATTDTAPVGSRPLGASPFGALDMAGNAWEWTSTALRPYPYDAQDGRESGASTGSRVVRGGSFIHGSGELRCSYRHGMLAGAVDHYVGFRVAAAPSRRLRADVGMVDVPAGDVLLGNDPRPSSGPAAPDEAPRLGVSLPGVQLAATPVTNAQYLRFVRQTGHAVPPHWYDGVPPAGLEQHPVTYVDWFDAGAFCRWAGARLPTEAEWEKGARGTDARLYPWGDREPDAEDGVSNQHNVRARLAFGLGSKRGTTTAVGTFPAGSSPYGLLDMAGNVWEWTSTAYAPYPYRADDGRESPSTGAPRALRGGSFASMSPRLVRCASRSRSYPGRRSAHIGFRPARAPASIP